MNLSDLLEAAEQLNMGEAERVAEKEAAQVAEKEVERLALWSRN